METATPNSFRRIINIIKQSLNGEEQDYTTGSIPLAIVLLAIPMILELSLESVFAVVDMFFVGKLGENAIATVGLTESVVTIVYSLAMGLSMAATAIIARRTGEKNAEGAAHAGAQAIIVGGIISVILGIAGAVFGGDILALMGASPKVVADGTTFAQIYLGSAPAIMFLFLINGIFRGAGNAAMAMKSLWIASLLNIILCPILIHFYGLKGAAIATAIGRSVGVLYQCYYLFKGSNNLRITAAHFGIDWDIIRSIFKIGSPGALQFIIASGSWIVLTRLVAETDGTTASAGYIIAMRNIVFFILPAWGLSNAAATLVGQNLGAGKPERAEKSVMLTAKYSAIFMAFVAALFIAIPEPIIRIFTAEEPVIAYGIQALRIIGSGFIFYGIGMVMTQALNGAGDTRIPTIINIVGFWLIQIPLAYLLAKGLHLNSLGVFIAIPTSETLIAIMGYFYFKRGRWKEVKV
ncbi:MAG: MATE family efflux transporter [Sphingobacteriales bacterium JAD_PAG50586_3]|nr:MAG: MATE family efflux transporter [Sphingobacteriales bacterium JAD_PAG50586_3]